MAEADTQRDGADTRQISQGIDSSVGKSKGDRKRLMENCLSLCLLHGARHIPPLIDAPNAIRVLKQERLGPVIITRFFISQLNLVLSIIFLSEILIFTTREYNPMPSDGEWEKALIHGKL